jgi:hypothetical protein
MSRPGRSCESVPGDLEDNRAGLQAGEAAGRLTCRPLAELDRLVILQPFDDAGELTQVQVERVGGRAGPRSHAAAARPVDDLSGPAAGNERPAGPVIAGIRAGQLVQGDALDRIAVAAAENEAVREILILLVVEVHLKLIPPLGMEAGNARCAREGCVHDHDQDRSGLAVEKVHIGQVQARILPRCW